MSTTLEYFWHLSAASKAERLDASSQLIGALVQFQAAHEPTSTSAAGTELEQRNAPDVAYAIKRLVRGLASPRESSRLGFSAALTELLSRIDTIGAGQMITLILEASETSGAMKGQEERDMLFARLFGLTALAQSGLLVRAGLATEDDFVRAVDALSVLGARKSWLQESAVWAVLRALEALHNSDVDWRDKAVKHVLKDIFAEGKEWTPEKVALALQAQKWFPEVKWKKMVAPTFKDANLLSTGHLSTISKIFKVRLSSVDDDAEPKQSGGNWKPQLHFAWDVILDAYYPPASDEKRGEELSSVQDFFRIVVDETFFASSASSERKYWGFLIFQKFAQRVPSSELPLLLTRNFMRTWINHLSHPDRYLHKIAKQVALDVQKLVAKDPRAGFALVLELLGRNGNRQFDQITRTKTVESILSSMNASGIQEYVDHLLGQIGDAEADSDAKSIEFKRLWIIDQLAILVRNGAVPKDDACVKTILDFFVVHGFFELKKKSAKSSIACLCHVPEPPFSDELRKECRSRLLAALADLLTFTSNKKASEDTPVRQPGYAQDGELWLTKVWNTVSELEKDTKHVAPARSFSEDEQTLRKQVLDAVAALKKAPSEKEALVPGVQLLLVGGLLQELSADSSSSTEDLEDCIGAVPRMFAAKPKSKSKSKGKDKSPSKAASSDAEEEPEPIDIFVNFLIGYLERGTAYTKAIATRAFEPLCSALQASTVSLILSQLERRPVGDEHSADEDVEMEGDEEEDASQAASSSDEDEDAEVDDEDEDSDDDDDDSIDDDDDDDEEEEADPELRSRIEEALRLSGVEPAGEDSDEELMDDDQMMQLDEHLADIFRLRKSEKGGAKQGANAQREATHFKNRVLDLVDIFIRKQATSPHIPAMVLPLLDLITGTGQDEKQLQDKASGILRSRLGKNKELPELADTSETEDVFKHLHERARKARSGQVLAVISQSTVYVARVLAQHARGALVAEQYGESVKDYATRKSSPLTTSFFLDFVRRLHDVAWGIRSPLLEAMREPVNFYRATQVFLVFQSLTSPLPSVSGDRLPLVKIWREFRKVLYDTITKACEAEPAPKAAQLKDVLKVGHAAMRQSKRADVSEEVFSEIWDAPRLATLAETVAGSPRFKTAAAVQTLMRQLNGLANPSLAPKKAKVNGVAKRKVDEQDVDSSAKRQRKKVRKNKE
ncbi:hypothetical protein AURDEDRAFT_63592 [Auricularia subglabra TFB-10046 SS5]|nr:hypothetical protein AURDEDRAFT_63592 [Auricularia subglabra TFB-10046 SS5]